MVERAARKRSVVAVLGVVERQGSAVLASDLAGAPDVLVPDGQAAQSLDALAEIAREVPVEHLELDHLGVDGVVAGVAHLEAGFEYRRLDSGRPRERHDDYPGRVGDVVVADSDGVVVVPLQVAREVGEAANRAQFEDQERRSEYDEEAGMEKGFTLE